MSPFPLEVMNPEKDMKECVKSEKFEEDTVDNFIQKLEAIFNAAATDINQPCSVAAPLSDIEKECEEMEWTLIHSGELFEKEMEMRKREWLNKRQAGVERLASKGSEFARRNVVLETGKQEQAVLKEEIRKLKGVVRELRVKVGEMNVKTKRAYDRTGIRKLRETMADVGKRLQAARWEQENNALKLEQVFKITKDRQSKVDKATRELKSLQDENKNLNLKLVEFEAENIENNVDRDPPVSAVVEVEVDSSNNNFPLSDESELELEKLRSDLAELEERVEGQRIAAITVVDSLQELRKNCDWSSCMGVHQRKREEQRLRQSIEMCSRDILAEKDSLEEELEEDYRRMRQEQASVYEELVDSWERLDLAKVQSLNSNISSSGRASGGRVGHDPPSSSGRASGGRVGHDPPSYRQ